MKAIIKLNVPECRIGKPVTVVFKDAMTKKSICEDGKDFVSQRLVDQLRWELDIALKQLADIGKGFAEKMDDVAKVVKCKDCEYKSFYCTEDVNGETLYSCKHPAADNLVTHGNWFCANGRR